MERIKQGVDQRCFEIGDQNKNDLVHLVEKELQRFGQDLSNRTNDHVISMIKEDSHSKDHKFKQVELQLEDLRNDQERMLEEINKSLDNFD